MEDRVPPPEQLTERELEILSKLSAGLSDQQIADALFLSLNTVKWYNRQIYGKLGVAGRTQAVIRAKALGTTPATGGPIPPASTSPPSRHNVPSPSTPFVGRRVEVAELRSLLRDCRLLTLTGAGGIGKTRLALRLAAEVAGEFADGVYFVDLAPLADPTLVPRAIARALGVATNPGEPLTATLERALAQRETLLLVDNFEHLLQAAPVVSDLLAASPRSRALITSREPLRLAGEQEYPVPPLSLPTGGPPTTQSVVQSEAGTLFAQRARMSQPHFEVGDDNAPAVASICRRLDGIPLALELAAARCKMLSPSALLVRLEGAGDGSPLRALGSGSRDAPERQRTLRASIEWSYDLLDSDDKVLFARLAVFRGGCSLEAVEAVCGEALQADVFDALASLVDKSLVRQEEVLSGEPRFSMLEMVREYARERLEASGEATPLRRRHATYFVELAERVEPELRLAGFDFWCRRLELELDNVRAALEWSLSSGEVALGVRLAGASNLFWYGKRHHVEGLRWANLLLARLDEVPVTYHARFLIFAGHMLWFHDLDAAQALFRRALDTSRALGDNLQAAWALAFLGYTTMQQPEAAIPMAEEALALFRELDYRPGIAQTLNNIGEIARLSGDDGRARQAYEECLAVCQETGEARRIYYMQNNLTYIAQHEGDHQRALDLGRQGLNLARARDSRPDVAQALMTLAGSIVALGQPRKAALLLSSAEAAHTRMGALIQPNDRRENDRIAAAARSELGDSAFETAWADGQAMTLDQAVEYALSEEQEP